MSVLLTSQEGLKAWCAEGGTFCPLGISPTPCLPAAEEAGVFQCYSQLCCPPVGWRELALRQPKPGNEHLLPAVLPLDPQFWGLGRVPEGWTEKAGRRRAREALHTQPPPCWISRPSRSPRVVLGVGPKTEVPALTMVSLKLCLR